MTDAALPAVAVDPVAAARRKRVVTLVVHVLLIGASIVMLYPLFWMFSASVRPEQEIFTSPSIWPSEWSLEAYRRMHMADLDATRIAQFLILQREFPRSIRFCVDQLHAAITGVRVSNGQHSPSPPERIVGRLGAPQGRRPDPADVGRLRDVPPETRCH